ncbi:2-oxoacid:acceptor oxidoreductase subunit alpha [Rhodococcus opacus]|uniref:2-oxoacid:acceptor oxidoreductase subunit alpha n=1 Tax=Rhodococcus opacus TaxID=37919 RepID=UPI000EAA6F22|nr:2-oxoacid:acceptor oxidoreductase subunit alpha [Rhodococcus opacus]QZS52578.1 2-oxoacid:acceptor oxidoreductase subunit alpha [Rhodococcus opacus]RKM64876.1 2-oxoglutarate ferredoxin oxidoreductase subunit alpha [Rhodococcus opacus]
MSANDLDALVVSEDSVVIRIAGDSGDGIQLAGERLTAEAALAGNDYSTLPSFPAEIRAPAGVPWGISSFQLQFADHDLSTAGDRPDVLVAMGPAALKQNLADLPDGGILIVNTDEFTRRNLAKAGMEDPLAQETLSRQFQLHTVPMGSLTREALRKSGRSNSEVQRAKTMFALGLLTWMYGHSGDLTRRHLQRRFEADQALAKANILAFDTGYAYGETTESFAGRHSVASARLPAGRYRQMNGNTALALGLITAGHLSGLPVFLGSYPITPASDILHELAKREAFGVSTFQAEDEIAGIGAALGASFGGALGVTTTSGPGMALTAEMIGLAVSLELPLVIVDVQRGGPSTGLPTRTEQSDLFHALYGRSGEAPVPVLAARTPGDCFDSAIDAARIAITYRTPVVLLSDGGLAIGSEPWCVPRLSDLQPIDPAFTSRHNAPDGTEAFWPYLRDATTGARPWAVPGTPGLEHRIGGLEKADGHGGVSYDPENHQRMVRLRAAKIAGVDIPEIVIDDPNGNADLLVLAWGSTYGAVAEARSRVRQQGHEVAYAHLRHLNPLPQNLAAILDSYPTVLVLELNSGHLASVLRSLSPRADIISHTQITGLPFRAEDIAATILSKLDRQQQSQRAPGGTDSGAQHRIATPIVASATKLRHHKGVESS